LEETLFIGNDPLQDIAPAAARGLKTALFTRHPDSFRPGDCTPDFVIRKSSDRRIWDHRKCMGNSE
jgi:FMN phosphatase YigB (HAD superfamily)